MTAAAAHRLSSPRIHLVRMVVFLILVAFLAFILYQPIWTAFLANPGLNGLIIAVLAIGIILALAQIARLFSAVAWVNEAIDHGREAPPPGHPPPLVAPMAALLGEPMGRGGVSMGVMRSILDSIAIRLDEHRDIVRYLAGLLVFLGLLGTFWGLLETVGSVGNIVRSMRTGAEAGVLFDELKNGLAAPLGGMGISFSSSLFGLAGSLVLGFLDLQTGQAQNRFYTGLEDWLSAAVTDEAPAAAGLFAGAQSAPEIAAALERLSVALATDGARPSTQAVANLAEGVRGLVQHMRTEQQLVRDWVEAQAAQQKEIRRLLERLADENITPRLPRSERVD